LAPNNDIHYTDKQSVQTVGGRSVTAAPGDRLQGTPKLIPKFKNKLSALNNFYIIKTNNKKFNKCDFLKNKISISGGHCDYSPWVPKNPATSLVPRN